MTARKDAAHTFSRRDCLGVAAATAAIATAPAWWAGAARTQPLGEDDSAALGASDAASGVPAGDISAQTADRASALFIGHGGPNLFRRKERGAQLAAMLAPLATRPTAVLAMTPHRRTDVITLAGHKGGRALRSFPGRFAKMVGDFEYRPPAAPELGARVLELLREARFSSSDRGHRGFDHTVWGPLVHLFPLADIPVIQVGMPFLSDGELFRLGRALAPLADDGVIFLASGQLTHNLGAGFGGETPSWASEFDAWAAETLAAGDIDRLLDWRHAAPGAELAHPDDGGHFRVIMPAVGFAVGARPGLSSATFPHAGFENGHFSRRGVVLS